MLEAKIERQVDQGLSELGYSTDQEFYLELQDLNAFLLNQGYAQRGKEDAAFINQTFNWLDKLVNYSTLKLLLCAIHNVYIAELVYSPKVPQRIRYSGDQVIDIRDQQGFARFHRLL